VLDTDSDTLFDEFCEGNYSRLEELSDTLSQEQRHELAQLLVMLSEVTEKTRYLMEWVYEREISAAASPMMIFKTDINMMSTCIGNHLCYSYSCIRWLKFITVPLVQYLESQSTTADVISQQGVQVLLAASDIALTRFFDSIYDVPLWLRQACGVYQRCANQKFGVAKGTPRPPGLLCGYLVSVLLTEKNTVIGETTTKVRNGLRAVAGLLLQLGYQFGTINNPLVEDFIQKKSPDLINYYNEFVNPEGIAMTEHILASSKPKVFAKEIRLRNKRQRFARVLAQRKRKNSMDETQSMTSEPSTVSNDSENALNLDSYHLVKKMDDVHWRFMKSYKCGTSVYTLKAEDSHFVAIKCVTRIRSGLVEAANFFSTKISDPHYDTDITFATRSRVSENSHLISGYAELPWPLGNRYLAFTQTEVLDPHNKKQILYVSKNASYPGQKKKGYVEMKVLLSGIRVVVDPHDPSFVIVTVITHADPGGALPPWFVNKTIVNQSAKIPKIVKALEEWNECNSSSSPISIEQLHRRGVKA
jgi:hypothetical protein